MSVDTDTPVLGAGNETSWTCPRRRIEYGGNQIFVKISSRFCLLWWVIPPVRGNGVQRRRLESAHHGETVTPRTGSRERHENLISRIDKYYAITYLPVSISFVAII